MDEDNALAIARGLSRRGVRCRLTRATPRDYGLLVPLHNGNQAVWNLHRDRLEARVLRKDGTLIGFVPLHVRGGATADDVARLLAEQRYERLSSTGRSSGSAASSGSASRDIRNLRPIRDRQRGRRRAPVLLLVAALLLTMLLLYVLVGSV